MASVLTRFPASVRFGAVTIAMIAVAGLAPLHAGAEPPSAQEVQNARDRVAQLAREVRVARAELDDILAHADAITVVLDREQGRYELITARLLSTQRDLATARARYESIVARLNERAQEAFMTGPGSNVEFLLGATSLTDLSDRLEFVDAVAQSDADLATEVQNTKNALSAREDDLEKLQAQQKGVLARLRDKKAEVEAALADAQRLVQEIQSKKEEATDLAQRLSKKRQDWLRSQFVGAGTHASVAMPPGWAGTFQVCPVVQPRAYGDGFGAPRYAGGFHLHAGVDIVAPRGTPIVAPFAGTARTSYNGLGGQAVYVYGAKGYVYNAHLDSYSSASNGPVQPGDVIGYVGDTGDAQGGITHDHFEFHPNAFPGDWPTSYYGYRVIGTALNPYPLLVDACH
jgi:peptidoglycan hydrolase CwlO-like protein